MTEKITFGYMSRGQYPLGDDMALRFDELLEQARTAEAAGYDCYIKSSHYSGHPLMELQQMPLLSRLSAEVPKMRLCAGIVLLPLHKPLDVAEQFATLDVMTNGKAIFGAGIGYRDVEFHAFGTTKKESRQRFEENLDAIKRLWTEDTVTMKGSHFELDGASCALKPVQKPHPPIWIGANADIAIRRAARMADAWFVNPHNRIDTIERQVDIYKRELDACGKPFPDEFPMMREVFVAATREDARRLAQPYLETKYAAYHEWGQDKAMPKGDNDLGMAYDELIRDRFLLGTPEEVAEQILKFVHKLGVNHFIFGVQWPGMPHNLVIENTQMLGEEVFPLVRRGL